MFWKHSCLALALFAAGCVFESPSVDLGPDSGHVDGALATVVFQQGVDGYNRTADTFLAQNLADDNFGSSDRLSWSQRPAEQAVALIRFEDLFGDAPAQVPLAAAIVSARIELFTLGGGEPPGFRMHEVLVDWDERSATWSNFGGQGGVQSQDIGRTIHAAPASGREPSIDVTESIAQWIQSPGRNLGWIVMAMNDGVREVSSSEYFDASMRPRLTVTWSLETP